MVFLSSKMSRPLLEPTNPLIQFMWGGFFLGDVGYCSFPSNASFKNEWSYTSTPPICLCVMCRENVTLE